MNIIQKQQQRELEKIEICMDIWKQARNELYLSMRFLDVSLSRFFFLAGDEYNRDGDRWIWHLFLSGCIDLPV